MGFTHIQTQMFQVWLFGDVLDQSRATSFQVTASLPPPPNHPPPKQTSKYWRFGSLASFSTFNTT